jgi:hypothetical protein
MTYSSAVQNTNISGDSLALLGHEWLDSYGTKLTSMNGNINGFKSTVKTRQKDEDTYSAR